MPAEIGGDDNIPTKENSPDKRAVFASGEKKSRELGFVGFFFSLFAVFSCFFKLLTTSWSLVTGLTGIV